MASEIKRDSKGALYSQVAEMIKDQIADGSLKANEKLRTEKELCTQYQVSRITIRKALEILCEEGLIYKKQGVGTFVSEKRLVRNANRMMSFTESCEINGQTASSKLIFAGLVPAGVKQQRALGVNEGDSVICIRRLRYSDGVSIMVEDDYFQKSYAWLLGEDLLGSLHRILEKHNVKPVTGTKAISICYATKEEAELLDVRTGSALLLQKEIGYDEGHHVIYQSKSVINTNRYELLFSNSV